MSFQERSCSDISSLSAGGCNPSDRRTCVHSSCVPNLVLLQQWQYLLISDVLSGTHGGRWDPWSLVLPVETNEKEHWVHWSFLCPLSSGNLSRSAGGLRFPQSVFCWCTCSNLPFCPSHLYLDSAPSELWLYWPDPCMLDQCLYIPPISANSTSTTWIFLFYLGAFCSSMRANFVLLPAGGDQQL